MSRPYPVRLRSPLRRSPDAAAWHLARDISQRAEPDVRPLGRTVSAFIAERTRRVHPADRRCAPSAFIASCPLRWQAASGPPCRRRTCPIHYKNSALVPHGALCSSSLIREASPARRYYADLGCQGARRLLQQRTFVAPSATSVMFLGPHVGAQYPYACPS